MEPESEGGITLGPPDGNDGNAGVILWFFCLGQECRAPWIITPEAGRGGWGKEGKDVMVPWS
jgi:hypothetical protein